MATINPPLKEKPRGIIAGLAGRIWYVAETLFSYGYAILESFVFIAFSGLFIAVRSYFIKNEEDNLIVTSSGGGRNSVKKHVNIYYASQTGTAQRFAEQLFRDVEKMDDAVNCPGDLLSPVKNLSLTEVEHLSELGLASSSLDSVGVAIFIVPTYEDGAPPDSAEWFFKSLAENAVDFRVSKSYLKKMNYAVFGLGNSLYCDNFNKVAKQLDYNLAHLGAQRLLPLQLGNENSTESDFGSLVADFNMWKRRLLKILLSNEAPAFHPLGGITSSSDKNSHPPQDEDLVESSSEDEAADDTVDQPGTCGSKTEIKINQNNKTSSGDLVDLEDIGSLVITARKKIAREKQDFAEMGNLKEMVTPELRKALTKQGYKLIGSHSGVKLCRWTKSMLRGRGGCYKHTFYGIASHQCMEATPSLACANKCVFCWRHHSNPVGTEWKWKMDEAQMILDGALQNHYKMIKEFQGVPGVSRERIEEGLHARHCALSLVGEPIMYPEINKFVKLLHAKNISSFLVTNAQFPDAIRAMSPVTQLYVSVDAATKESLKKIDRPLFKDFWERFLDSLKEIKDKGQRTVYRLTLVKDMNVAELQNYAKLVELGDPDFIEIKGVTYCGTSKASTLTMENVPWHEEVVSFSQSLCTNHLPNYELACEHEHSNCILLANKRFKIDGAWHTWIDYDKFHQLVQKYYDSDGTITFNALDYAEKSPSWAVYGSNEKGFDPEETRWMRKSKNKDISGC
ncbi:S-adenosyl-L-methionine-dependent tRNA 4-demethylwyosine synthase TYW1 [Folsomia candida]|uniref:S-adenosyl-L-methionine-dependent tRNA 4-demethylwyosine synthase TYW1 n=1 Tax=Folsomia candida TaxID=158441 RepID=UPI000B8F6E58|nr:S-adenosyl-L-methionine-dependent tRNA 4-demethylwyosine synthase TYW1 [Folsomia candida]